jgi:hypothetical protein
VDSASLIRTSGTAREYVAGIRAQLRGFGDPGLVASIGWQLDALDGWLSASCTACHGHGILANINGEMVPVSSWTGAWAEQGDGGLQAIHLGEAIRCTDCVPDFQHVVGPTEATA